MQYTFNLCWDGCVSSLHAQISERLFELTGYGHGKVIKAREIPFTCTEYRWHRQVTVEVDQLESCDA